MLQSIPIDEDFTLPVLWALGWGVELTSWIPSPDAFCAATTLLWCLLQIRRSSLRSIGILPSHLYIIRRLSIALLVLTILAIGVLICEHFDNVKSRWIHVLLNVSRIGLFETVTNGLALLFSARSASSTASLLTLRVAAAGSFLYAFILGSLMVGDFIRAGDANGIASSGVRIFVGAAHATLAAVYALYFLILRKGRPSVRPYAWFSVVWRTILSLSLFLSLNPPDDRVFQAWILDVALLALFIFGFPLSIRAAFRADAAFWRGIPQVDKARRLRLSEWTATSPKAAIKVGLRHWSSLLNEVRPTSSSFLGTSPVDSNEGTGLLTAKALRANYGIGHISSRKEAIVLHDDEPEEGGEEDDAETENTGIADAGLGLLAAKPQGSASNAYTVLVQQLRVWAEDVNDLPDECLDTLMDLVEAATAVGYLLDFKALESQIPVYKGTEAVVLRGTYCRPLKSALPAASTGDPGTDGGSSRGTTTSMTAGGRTAHAIAVKVASPIKTDRLAMERICAEVAVNIQLSEAIRACSAPLVANTGFGYSVASVRHTAGHAASGVDAPLHGLLQKWIGPSAAPGLTVSALEVSRYGSGCIVPFYGICVCPPDVALVFPWCEGSTLRVYLDTLIADTDGEVRPTAVSDPFKGRGDSSTQESKGHSYGLIRYSFPLQIAAAAGSSQASYASNGADVASAGLTLESAGVTVLRRSVGPSRPSETGDISSLDEVAGLTDVGLFTVSGEDPRSFGHNGRELTSDSIAAQSSAPAAWALSPDEAETLADETATLQEYVSQGILTCEPAPAAHGTTFRSTNLHTVQPLHLAVAARTMPPGVFRLASTAWIIGCSPSDVAAFPWDSPQEWSVADIAGLWKCWQCRGGSACPHVEHARDGVRSPSKTGKSAASGAGSDPRSIKSVAQSSVVQRLSIALDAARALAFLHGCLPRPLLHRDIKSLNILLTASVSAAPASRAASAGGARQKGDSRSATGSVSKTSYTRWKALLGDFGESRALAAHPQASPMPGGRTSFPSQRAPGSMRGSTATNGTQDMWRPEDEDQDPNGGEYIGPDDDYRDRHVSDAPMVRTGASVSRLGSVSEEEEDDSTEPDLRNAGRKTSSGGWWGGAGRSFGIGLPLARTDENGGKRQPQARAYRNGAGRPRAGSVQQMTGNVGTSAWMAPEVLRVQEEAEELTERGGVLALRGPESLSRSRTRTSRAISAGFGPQAKYGTPADVYSLGLVLWELATGGSPHEVGVSALKQAVGPVQTPHAGDYAKLTKASATLHARPQVPPCMPSSYRYLMSCCWHPQQECRPPAALVAMVLQRMLEEAMAAAQA